jgi:Ni/Fe-hydrogenase subunit HybB-like protein
VGRPEPRLGSVGVVLWGLVALCGYYVVVRFAVGLNAVANINDAYPWGWWVGAGVMSFIAFGAVGFTVALLVEILGRHRYAPLVRPAVVVGLLFYLSYLVILCLEIGRPWKGWILFFSWADTSPLFEIAWCATIYTVCLMIEFGKMAAKNTGLPSVARVLGWFYLPAVVLGVTLSHFHQSSLGTLMTIVPLKVDPLWWSEMLPVTFLISAYISGLAVITIEHLAATRWLRLQPRIDLLAGLARIQAGLALVYLIIRVGDIVYRGVAGAMVETSWLAFSLWFELVVGFLIPAVIFLIPELRRTRWGLYAGSALLLAGAVATRLDVAVVAMEVKSWQSYFPALGEFATTFGTLAGAILVYSFLLRHLPIHEEPPLVETEEHDAADFAHGAQAVG